MEFNYKNWYANRKVQGMLFAARPDLFSLESPVPLKIGIHADLVAAYPGIKPWRIGSVLGWLVNRRAYLEKCIPGAVRFGFDGPSGTVDSEQVLHAKQRLDERNVRARSHTPAESGLV